MITFIIIFKNRNNILVKTQEIQITFFLQLNMKTLTPISPEKNKKEKGLSSMLETMENKHGE